MTTTYLCIFICITFVFNMILSSVMDDKLEERILDLKKKYKDLEEKITKIENDKEKNYETLD